MPSHLRQLLFAVALILQPCLGGLARAAEQAPAPSGSVEKNGKTYALLIGISKYKADPLVQPLQYADKDAETFADLLKTPVGGKLNELDAIKLITNEQATRAGIDDAVRNFVNTRGGPADTLILFIAAHGIDLRTEVDPAKHLAIEREPYILTYESNPDDPKTTGYPMSEFRELVAREAAHFGRVFVYVDVCHAANIAGIAGGSALQPDVKQVFDGLKGELDLLLASHARAYAYESAAFGGGHGAFSYFLISGLNGAAALPGLTSITFDDLGLYVENQVYLFTGRAQRPTALPTNPGVVVVENTKLGGLTLPPASPMSATDKRAARRGRVAANAPPAESGDVGRGASDDPFVAALRRGLLLPEEAGSAFGILAGERLNAAPSDQVKSEERRLRVALEDRGQEIMLKYLQGDQTAQTKSDFELCGRYFEEAFKLAPDTSFNRSRATFCQGRALIFDAQAAAMRGRMNESTSLFDEAESKLRASIQSDPRHGYAYNALGIAELERVLLTRNLQGLDAAEADFLRAMRFAPYWAYPIHNLALAASERGDWDEAIRLYEQAMSIAPWYSYLPYNLGLLYERLGDLEDAEFWFERALRVTGEYNPKRAGAWPERARIWVALGTVAGEREEEKKAERYFEKALADDPSDENARHNLALIFARRGEYAKSDDLWAQNLASSPPFLPSRMAYASSLASRGEKKLAIEQLREVVAERGEYVGAREKLARLLLSQADIESAREQVEEALKVARSNAGLLELRGDVFLKLGCAKDAQADWLEALNLASDRTIRTRLKRKLRETGNSLAGRRLSP
jgi:tetratricopeptide (TPR) repeat protein